MCITLAGKLCHVCSALTLILTIVAFAFAKIKGRYDATASTLDAQDPMQAHFQLATFILGTAWVLEFFQVAAFATHNSGKSEDFDCSDVVPRSHLPRWTDSQLMLTVYTVLFGFYSVMAAGSFGLVHVDPFASNRPVYSLRYVEWSIAVPILMTLVGRSVPRSSNSPPADLLPAALLTVVYIYASLLALIVESYAWRMVLIVISFIGYGLAAWDQYNWTAGLVANAPAARLSCALVAFQVVLFGVYGVVYLVAAFDLVSPVAEQALYTFGDATAKVGHSAVLLSMRQQQILAAVRLARREAAFHAADLSRLIDAASAPILSVDLNGRVSTWNRKLAELTGRSADSMKGTLLLDVVSPQCHGELEAAIEACASASSRTKEDRPTSFHADLLAAVPLSSGKEGDDGSSSDGEQDVKTVSLIMSATPQRASDGSNAGVVCVGQDRTEVVHYKAVEERKNRFMATVSHELRSPLHGICGLAASLERGEPDEQRRKQILMVRSCATRLLDLVVNIMDMSAQRNARQKSLAKDPVHLSAILDEVVALIANAKDKAMKPLLSEDCNLENKISGALPLVEGDSYKLTQVFFNLLTNACKFCRSGRIEVTSDTDRAKRLVKINVSDTGIGIAPEALKRIFEPFEQEDSSVGRRFEGIGLGLSVSDGVVRQHGGTITVKSTVGKGSVFTVSLPLIADVAAAAAESDRQSEAESTQTLSRRSSLAQRRPTRSAAELSSLPVQGSATRFGRPVVLSVDDDAVNQEVVKTALPEYEVHAAMDGTAALLYFTKNSRLPDIVLLDVMMPGMSGFEVCSEVRNRLKLPPSVLPILMLSAKEPVPDAIIEGLGSGCNDYIAKPFDVSVLQARVRTALQVKRLHEVEVENAQHMKLLHEIMPSHIVERLLSGETCIAESHKSVTILFSDIVGWTNIAESIPTSSVITLLNELFSAFDALLEQHGVYKVETIGDAYMVAAGHDGCDDHAERVMRMGLAMLSAVSAVRPPPNMRLQIRVGVHSGPAFTGVVGQKVPRFCFFGDTVNVSSRMESNGVPGCIHISGAARECLGDVNLNGPSIVSRGVIDVKGKGRMETHFVVPPGVTLPPLDGGSAKVPAAAGPGPESGDTDGGASSKKLLREAQAQLAESNTALAVLRKERDDLAESKVALAVVRKERDELAESAAALAGVRKERDELRKRSAQLEQTVQSMTVQAHPPAPPTQHTPKKTEDASGLCPLPADISTQGSIQSASDANVTSLRLQLSVKTKALDRARRALLGKEDEIDAKELELQYALASLSDTSLAQVLMTATSSDDGQLR